MLSSVFIFIRLPKYNLETSISLEVFAILNSTKCLYVFAFIVFKASSFAFSNVSQLIVSILPKILFGLSLSVVVALSAVKYKQ